MLSVPTPGGLNALPVLLYVLLIVVPLFALLAWTFVPIGQLEPSDTARTPQM
jgi:hypothetical protein